MKQHKLHGKLYIFVGPSGVGKNTVMERIMQQVPGTRKLPTYTTRAPRPGEVTGRDHFFVSAAEFKNLIVNEHLIEYEEVHPGKFYGVPRRETEQLLRSTERVIADVDILGALALKNYFPENVTIIFIKPPSIETLADRLRLRGQITEQELQERLSRVSFEIDRKHLADYQVCNDNLDQCVTEILELIAGIQ